MPERAKSGKEGPRSAEARSAKVGPGPGVAQRAKPGWPWPRLLAHRGGGVLAPENTLEAIDIGFARGFRAAEIDAALTADDVPVLLHDDTLERTSNGHGALAALRLADLAGLDFGAWHSPAFAGARIPTLAATLEHCAARGVWLNVEIKPTPGREAQTGTRVAQVVGARYPRGADGAPSDPATPLLSSFSVDSLRSARAAAPWLPRALLVEKFPAGWQALARELGCVAVHCDHHHLTPELARAVHDEGRALFCYTVNDAARLALLRSWGMDAACTDRIDVLSPGD
jgi:glycerophosphoryl diester phosphodiesterase